MYPKVNILYPKRIQMYPKMDTFYMKNIYIMYGNYNYIIIKSYGNDGNKKVIFLEYN